ncbi:hypothetical protein AQ505_17380 [Pedobacter sp. PACM 27299]|nr:hypothetical protein AQ505_17380 [Pedobacter sp. PACM 27299]
MLNIIYKNTSGNYNLVEAENKEKMPGTYLCMKGYNEIVCIFDKKTKKVIYKCGKYMNHYEKLKNRFKLY